MMATTPEQSSVDLLKTESTRVASQLSTANLGSCGAVCESRRERLC